MKFWTPDFAKLTDSEEGQFVFPEQPSELVDILWTLANQERERRGLDTLQDSVSVEVRPDIATLGILSRTATKGEILCYNLEQTDLNTALNASGKTEVIPLINDLFQTAAPYVEGR